ncbi:hypothetical protein QOT17_009908 [Balamuthia mandrillaris]
MNSYQLPKNWYNLAAAFSYGFFSFSAVIVNKVVLSKWDFNFPLTMIACQMIVSYGLLMGLKSAGLISVPNWSMETAKKAYPLALSHCINVILGLSSLSLVSIPMFSTLRRTGVAYVMALEFLLLKKRQPSSIIGSVGLIVLGALVAGWNDLNFDLFGYVLTCTVNVTTALALTLIPKIGKAADLGPLGLMLYQITLGFPLIVLAILMSGEYVDMLAYPHWSSPSFLILFFMSCAQIFVLNYSIFLCTTVNSPLTTTVTGALKDCAQTVGGFFIFDLSIQFFNLVGISIGMSGGILYSYLKYLESETRSKPAHSPEKDEPLLAPGHIMVDKFADADKDEEDRR